MAAPRRLAALGLLLACAACNLASHEPDALRQLRAALALEEPAARDAALARLRGAEPLVVPVWLASAGTAATPERALELVERGLAFRPDSPDLQLARLSLLAQLGRRSEQLAAARAALAQSPPLAVRAEVLWFLVDGLLATGQREEAEDAVVRLGALPGPRPAMVASAWARVALAHEAAGAPADGDRCLRAALDLGPDGLSMLRRDALGDAARQQAAHRLADRAAQREPDHPDLQLFLLVDRLAAGDVAGAQAAFDALSTPLPERLLPEHEALRARLLVLQDRVTEGLDVLRARLAEEPGDPLAVAVLLETWHVRHQPAAAEVQALLRAARRRLADPLLAQQVEATLAELQAELQPPPQPEPPAQP